MIHQGWNCERIEFGTGNNRKCYTNLKIKYLEGYHCFMKDCKSYIFIKENEAIIFQITDEINKIKYFYNGLLRCFAGQLTSIEQPIQITIDKIKNLEEYLRLNYQSDKRINKLIYFFKNTKENEYIYCYPYNENFDEIYDSDIVNIG